MNTSTPLDPRSLAHRLTTVGHTMHHRLFAQLRENELHPKTVLILRTIDGRIDAPWIADRIARGGKRLDALAERGWIARGDDGWALTDEGREILDRVDADRSALLADIPADELERLVAALDTLEAALGIDKDAPTGGFGPGGRGFGRGFGRGRRGGFGPGRRPGAGDGDRERGRDGEHGHDSEHGHGFGPRHGDGDHGRGHGHGFGPRHGGHGFDRGHRGADRAAQRAYERGFDAGFSRGRDSSASA